MHADADLYAVLDVASTSSADDIRAAYYRQVRRHPPEKDAEGFQRVQRAYDVLSNPETRREYDDQQRTDPETQRLLGEGRRLLEQDDDGALIPLKRALVRHPDSLVIRDLLVQALELSEDYETAEKHARLLIERAPAIATYHTRLGDVLRLADRDEEAEAPYRRALELDQETHQPVLNLAYLLNYLERYDEAVDLLERSILRDGRVDFEDFLFFQALCRVHVLNRKLDELARTRQRIREILPPDQETRSYVAWFYYKDALMLAERGDYTAALLMIEEAAEIDESLPELKATAAKIRGSKAALDEISVLHDDETILPELRFAVGPLVIMRLIGLGGDFKTTFANATRALSNHARAEGSPLGAHIRVLRQKYPSAAKVVRDFLEKVEADIARSDKPLIALTCPDCGHQGFAPGPSLETLVRAGLTASQAATVLRTRGRDGAAQYLLYNCQECGTLFNGISRKIDTEAMAGGTRPPSTPGTMSDPGCGRIIVWSTVGVVILMLAAVMIESGRRPSPARPDRVPTASAQHDAQTHSPKAPPEQPRPSSPGPEYYVANETLNLRSGAGTEHARIGQLRRFDTVRLVRETGTGWGRVRTANGTEGFVALSYLERGNGNTARQGWCRANAGPRPLSGEILERTARGPHKLTVTNDPGRDAVVKLKRGDQTVLAFYVRAGDTTQITTVPEGTVKTLVAYGSSYSRACGYFLDNLQVSKLDDSVRFETTYDANYRYTTTLTYTLYQVVGGNLTPKSASLDEFLD